MSQSDRRLAFALFACALLEICPASTRLQARTAFPLQARRILFLGDSITHGGGYVAFVEMQMRLNGIDPLPEIINLGLSSETCSGLSEAGHPFPRPDVHERLDRALAKLRPDVVVACYGMNDGIYHPFSEERFQAYQQGVLKIIDKVHASGARLVLMTPPPFDPLPLRAKGKLQPAGNGDFAFSAMYENYNDVLARYAAWIMTLEDRADMLIDLHSAMQREVDRRRQTDPDFTFSPDGIHPNAEGHRRLGEVICGAWGIPVVADYDPELLKLISRKTALLHDAWLSAVGHQRPGIKAGLPVEEATSRARELDEQITRLAPGR